MNLEVICNFVIIVKKIFITFLYCGKQKLENEYRKYALSLFARNANYSTLTKKTLFIPPTHCNTTNSVLGLPIESF